MTTGPSASAAAGGWTPIGVELYWLPLGSGEASGLVRGSGKAFEALAARHQHRRPCDLYHSALRVRLDGASYAIEMTPVWGGPDVDRGVVIEGPVGARLLGRSRLFRYEVRRWRGGVIPDMDQSVDSPHRLSSDRIHAQRVLDLVSDFPVRTWGRDELGTGDMWNSNSLTSWLLARSGHRTDDISPPANGRAPGWSAGLAVAARAGAAGLTSGTGAALDVVHPVDLVVNTV